MGYTHYWRGARDFTDAEWAAITDDARKLLAATTVPLWHEYDEPDTLPEITAEHIFFNGCDEDGHETFLLDRKPDDFQFCKTAAKPYDVVVCAMLIVAAHHAPDAIDVSSDGGIEDWRAGLDFTRQVLGSQYKMPFGDDADDQPTTEGALL